MEMNWGQKDKGGKELLQVKLNLYVTIIYET